MRNEDLALVEAMGDWQIGQARHPGAPGHWAQPVELQEACKLYVPIQGRLQVVGTFLAPEFAAYAAMAVNERRARREFLPFLQQPAWPRPPLVVGD